MIRSNLAAPIAAALLSALLFLGACKASPAAQAALDEIRAQRDASAQDARDARGELEDASARLTELELALADQTTGTAGERAAWELELAGLVALIQGLDERIALLQRVDENLEDSARLVKAEDAGSQASFWAQIAGTILGGGALGKLLGKFGPSRATVELGKVEAELAALQSALAAFENSPSRAAGEVGGLREKIAQLEGLISAFSGGLSKPLVPPNLAQTPPA